MTVYLGTCGAIELKRTAGEAAEMTLLDGDVSVEKRRFSPQEDFLGTFITGDQVDIATVDGSNLHFIEGHDFPDWRGYVFIDAMGGIRLFDTFKNAVAGQRELAIELVDWPDRQDLTMRTRGDNYTSLARVTEYDFTTDRNTIDTSVLGSQFVQQYEAGLIAGQGTIECYWEHQYQLCDPDVCPGGVEFSAYLAQLCIRLTQGADFFGRFFVFQDEDPGINSVWYEAECIVTSCTIAVAANTAITSSIQFVTTGQFKLMTGIPPAYLMKEDGVSLILQEDGSRIVVAE